MGWFLLGIACGWLISGLYWYNQTEDERAGSGAAIIGTALFIIAIIVGVNLGISSGDIPPIFSTPTPTSLGR